MYLLIPFLCPYLLLLLSSLKYLLSIYDLLSIVSVTWADGWLHVVLSLMEFQWVGLMDSEQIAK